MHERQQKQRRRRRRRRREENFFQKKSRFTKHFKQVNGCFDESEN
jgi:hypothetical protein